MAKIIFKCPYIKPGSGSAGYYTRYIATRDGAEIISVRDTAAPATPKQRDLIVSILRDMPGADMLLEYEDYTSNPTMRSASEFITQAIEQNLYAISGREEYVRYIGQRPRVEKRGEHGLFGDSDGEIVLSQVCDAVANHTGNIWTPIISLRREDAARLCYDNAARWQALLRSHAAELAEQMKIHPDNFRWYAAFHDESHHPHVHMVCWSTDPKEGFLTEKGVEGVKSVLAATIFKQDREHIYTRKQEMQREIDLHSLNRMQQLCTEIRSRSCDNPEVEELLLRLSKRLAKTGGKKVYGYLKRDVKDLVDRVVDALERDARIAECYAAWQDAQEQLVQTYSSKPIERIPLSRRKEFKKVKNMVIAEALHLGDVSLPNVAEGIMAPEDIPEPETAWQADEAEPHANWAPRYKQARQHLFGTQESKPDFGKAHALFLQEAESGNALAMHDLGRMYADGLGVDIDSEVSHEWYGKALAAFHEVESGLEENARGGIYLRYRIGKMYMAGLGTEQDYTKAAAWISQAAEDNHKYAQYSLGSLYYRGLGVARDYETAFGIYTKSAAQHNAYACYELGKMCRDGIGTTRDEMEATRHFANAFQGFVAMEWRSGDDKLQYRIGQMLQDGVGIEADPVQAQDYFERSAELNNPHAQYALAKLYLKSGEPENIVAAVALLQKSADGENPTAQYALGKLYRDGKHVEKDVGIAVEFFTRAAKQNNDFAAYALGRLYLTGEDVPLDIPIALQWLEQSAWQGNQFAQYQLGKLYVMGREVPRDREEALYWLEKSAAQGNEYAQFFIDHIDEIGLARDPDLFMASTNLLRQLGKIFEQEHQRMEQLPAIRIDRKRRRELQQKKLAQGHAYDDREPTQS